MQLILTVRNTVVFLLYLEGCWWCAYCISDVKCICAHSYSIAAPKGAGWFEIVHILVNYGVVCRHFGGLCEAISGDKPQPQNLWPISCVSWSYRGYCMHNNILIASFFPTANLIVLNMTMCVHGI